MSNECEPSLTMKGVVQIHAQAQRQAAFAYVADLENAPHWVLDLVSVTLETEWEPGCGAHYTVTVKMDNRCNVAELEITEYDPSHEFTHRDQGGPARFTSRFEFKPDNRGTLIVHHYTVCMTCLSILMSPLTNRWPRSGLSSTSRPTDHRATKSDMPASHLSVAARVR